MTPLDPLPNLIDQVYERVLAGITDLTNISCTVPVGYIRLPA